MASADYRLCDQCGRKAFYDRNLNYDDPTEQSPLGLDYLGDWAVLCADCAKEFKCVVVPRDDAKLKGPAHDG